MVSSVFGPYTVMNVDMNLWFPDLENWNGTDRHHFNAIVPDQDLVEVYI